MNRIVRGLYFSLFTAMLALYGLQTRAQDSLRMRTGVVYSVKIIEISDQLVKYRTYNNPDGPLYTVSKSMIQTLKLEGKHWETVNNAPIDNRRNSSSSSSASRKPLDPHARNHYIGINLLDLIRTDLTIYYEWIFHNKIGLRIPVTYGFRSGYLNPQSSPSHPFAFQRNIVFRTGIDLRLYSGEGLRKVRYVFGPSIYYMRVNRIIPDFTTTDPDFMAFKTGSSIRILFFNGIVINPVDYIQFGFDAGFGGDIDLNENNKSGYYPTSTPTVPKVQLNVHLGYRF